MAKIKITKKTLLAHRPGGAYLFTEPLEAVEFAAADTDWRLYRLRYKKRLQARKV